MKIGLVNLTDEIITKSLKCTAMANSHIDHCFSSNVVDERAGEHIAISHLLHRRTITSRMSVWNV